MKVYNDVTLCRGGEDEVTIIASDPGDEQPNTHIKKVLSNIIVIWP